MKKVLTLAAATILLVSLGCDETQYENAVEDRNEAAAEVREDYAAAGADGVVTDDEAEEVTDEVEDYNESVGEVAEQEGDLIESRLDD